MGQKNLFLTLLFAVSTSLLGAEFFDEFGKKAERYLGMLAEPSKIFLAGYSQKLSHSRSTNESFNAREIIASEPCCHRTACASCSMCNGAYFYAGYSCCGCIPSSGACCCATAAILACTDCRAARQAYYIERQPRK